MRKRTATLLRRLANRLDPPRSWPWVPFVVTHNTVTSALPVVTTYNWVP